MSEGQSVFEIIEQRALSAPDRPAFLCRGGAEHSFGELCAHSRFVASELALLGLEHRAAAFLGEVNYSGLCAALGCLLGSVPIITPDASLSENELAEIITTFDVGVLFFSAKHGEKAAAVRGLVPGLITVPEFEELFSLRPAAAPRRIVPPSSGDPAFLFFTSESGKPFVVTHKNICEGLASLAGALDTGSYTFLSPAVWGGAFDWFIGIIFPLFSGRPLIMRGEKRGVAKAIFESAATALTCTPDRLASLEKALKSRSAKVFGKAQTILAEIWGAAIRALGLGGGKLSYRRIHRLLGDKLSLIICGGAYADPDCIRQFTNWGFQVYNCYFLTEMGPVALSRTPGGRPVPLPGAELTPISGELSEIGEIAAKNGNAAFLYGGEPLPEPFHTGDIGRFSEDGSIEILGKRKTMLLCSNEAPVFPEQLSSILRRSHYISRCTVTGRFDTGTGNILVCALITPDYKAVSSALGSKYSENRLRIFIGHELEKLAPKLPHKINEFRLIEKKSS